VIQKPIGFGDKLSSGKNVSKNDIFMNDMSTVGMDSINPVENDYWCRLDDFLVSGDLDDLCPGQDDCNNGNDVVEERIVFQDVGRISKNCVETSMVNKDNNLLFDSQVRTIPVDECLWTTQFTVEDHVLTRIGQVCHDANAPLYVVDEIMSIFQDKYNKGLCMDRLFTKGILL